MSLNLATLLRESALRSPTKTALVHEDASVSYLTLHSWVQRVASGLRALGVQRGQHVALMLPSVPQFTLAYFACHYAGCPVVPLNPMLTPDEVEYHLRDSDAVAIIAWEGVVETVQAACERVPSCRARIVARAKLVEGSNHAGFVSLAELIERNAPMPEPVATRPDDRAVVLYTSGTTGQPKGAELSHFNLFYNAEYCATRLVPLPEGERVALVSLPLFHSFGQTVVQNRFLLDQGTLVYLPRFAPHEALRLMASQRVSFFAGVPTMYFAMLNAEHSERYDLSALRLCVSGGAAMPVEVMNAFDARYGVNILEGYGLSETSPVASFNVLDRPKKAGSIGLPIRGVEFRLLADDGSVVSGYDTPGELCIRGHNVMHGYYKRPEATAEAIVDGWFHTGDVATVDTEGYYRIVDRKKDMIIRGGYNVYPREIEEVLYAHPAVREAAVIGLPHASHGEEVCAVIACKAGVQVTQDDVIRHCREHLAAYKYPRVVRFMDELPKGSTGKILKRALSR